MLIAHSDILHPSYYYFFYLYAPCLSVLVMNVLFSRVVFDCI